MLEGKKKLNKSLLLILILSLGVFITACGNNGEGSTSSEVEASTMESEDENAVKEVNGVVVDATMNTLTIQGEDKHTYSFGTEGIEIETESTGIVIGNPVTISYRGKLDPDKESQDVEIQSIVITDSDEEGTSEARKKAEDILSNMTLEEKVGQMFIARAPETDGPAKVTQYNPGGYILFGRDFEGKTKEQVIQDIQSYQDAAKVPMLIGVDEEGGTVNRVSLNPNLRETPFKSPQELYAQGGMDLVVKDAEEKSDLLKSLGINLNFAPVADVSQDPNDFINARSFGQDAKETSNFVRNVVKTMNVKGMGSVLKHFPGYGNNADTHTGIAYDDRPYETFMQQDFLPFKAGITSGADMVLVAHNVVNSMDDQVPASISPKVHEILRNELGFKGVIVTDDLYMEGVKQFATNSEIAVQAVQAGNDLLCCTDFEEQIPAVIEATKAGTISEDRIDESVLRILELKISLGLI